MGKKLFVCNTVYQLFITLWLKETELAKEKVDIIISDHLNNSYQLAVNTRKYSNFDQCFWVESKTYTYFLNKNQKLENFATNCFPQLVLRKILGNKLAAYTELYIANIDRFTMLLYQVLKRKNEGLEIHVYEDGLATYSQTFKKTLFYKENLKKISKIKHILHTNVYKLCPISNDIVDVLVFAKNRVQWQSKGHVSIREIKKIESSNIAFRKKCNKIFEFDKKDIYKQKYIFFEQPFETDMGGINDLEIVNKLAQKVGKENLIVKTHPRNKINRFQNMGINTNQNSSIPWEVILLNMHDLSSKVLITVSSTCVITPWLLYGANTTVYSLYKLVRRIIDGEKLNKKGEDATYDLLQHYSDVITFVDDISEIK